MVQSPLGIDANTLEIRAIEVTNNAIGDAPMLPYLLDQNCRWRNHRERQWRWRRFCRIDDEGRGLG